MRIENDFEVGASVDRVWTYILDVERIAPCAPGAELTEVVDDRTWKGKLNVKLGPIGMSFAGTVVVQERDDRSHRIVLKADGREQRGKGTASAMVTARMESVDAGTRVSIETELTITGAAAQYGRGMIGDISGRLTGQFAECLQQGIDASGASDAPGAPDAPEASPAPGHVAPAPPVASGALPGVRLGLWAMWRAVVRLFVRLVRPRRRE